MCLKEKEGYLMRDEGTAQDIYFHYSHCFVLAKWIGRCFVD